MNTDAFKVFDSFNGFVKSIPKQTKLPQNLPFGFSVVSNITTFANRSSQHSRMYLNHGCTASPVVTNEKLSNNTHILFN